MGRQLFLHHYLPAHLASALTTGALVEFVFNLEPLTGEDGNSTPVTDSKDKRKPVSAGNRRRPVRERIASQSLVPAWIAAIVILSAVIWCFFFFAPLTYGQPGLTVPQVLARKWLGYDFHFAK
jgi:dolichyl-phosphate-mannose-protein mannosyltransferase